MPAIFEIAKPRMPPLQKKRDNGGSAEPNRRRKGCRRVDSQSAGEGRARKEEADLGVIRQSGSESAHARSPRPSKRRTLRPSSLRGYQAPSMSEIPGKSAHLEDGNDVSAAGQGGLEDTPASEHALEQSEQEAERNELAVVLDDAHADLDDGPEQHDKGDPAAGLELLEDEVGPGGLGNVELLRQRCVEVAATERTVGRTGSQRRRRRQRRSSTRSSTAKDGCEGRGARWSANEG